MHVNVCAPFGEGARQASSARRGTGTREQVRGRTSQPSLACVSRLLLLVVVVGVVCFAAVSEEAVGL